MINNPIYINYDQLESLATIIPEITIKSQNQNIDFSSGKLFTIKRKYTWGRFSYNHFKNERYLLNFMFRKAVPSLGNPYYSMNVLGMNFLNQKVLSFDSFTKELKITDASLPSDVQPSEFKKQVLIKVLFDIILFICLIVVIFTSIVSLDKAVLVDYKYYEEE